MRQTTKLLLVWCASNGSDAPLCWTIRKYRKGSLSSCGSSIWGLGCYLFICFSFFPSPAWFLMIFYCTCLYRGKDTPCRNLEWHLQNNRLCSAHISPQQYYIDSSSKQARQLTVLYTQYGFTIIKEYIVNLFRGYDLSLPHNQAFIAKLPSQPE